MKKNKKIILILIIAFLLVIIFNSNVLGISATINPDEYNPGDYETSQSVDYSGRPTSSKSIRMVGVILGVIRNISVVVAVISLMVIGIKYIFGSVEEKANYKQTLIPYIIGCVLAVSGTTLVSFIYNSVH